MNKLNKEGYENEFLYFDGIAAAAIVVVFLQ